MSDKIFGRCEGKFDEIECQCGHLWPSHFEEMRKYQNECHECSCSQFHPINVVSPTDWIKVTPDAGK